jgi:hypothetical protein
MGSTYTASGVEVRLDERVLTLFAALDHLGYDAGPLLQLEPLPRHELTPLRRKAREEWPFPPERLTEWRGIVEGKDLPLRAVIGAALAGELDKAIGPAWVAGGEPFITAHAPELRAEQVALTQGLEKPLARLRTFLKGSEGARVVLCWNPLDGRGRGYAIAQKDSWRMVVGPGRDGHADVALAVAQFARLAVATAAERAVPHLKDGELLAELAYARQAGSTSRNVADYVADNAGRALALAVTGGSAADAEAQSALGLWLVPELFRTAAAVEHGKSLDAWLAEGLAKVDGRRIAAHRGP